MHTRGKVPHFTLRPHPVVMGAFFFVLIVGLLLSMSLLSKEEGAGVYKQKAMLTLAVTGVICFCLAILATSKLWFSHLWKKNSTHARHKQHTQYHPATQNRRSSRRR
jgi:hypothetical protein